MKKKGAQSKEDFLVTAKLTAFWLEESMRIVAENPTCDKELNNETEECLGAAACALLRWRLHTGQAAGLIQIERIDPWEEDEFD